MITAAIRFPVAAAPEAAGDPGFGITRKTEPGPLGNVRF
jgi:hypothetical protein